MRALILFFTTWFLLLAPLVARADAVDRYLQKEMRTRQIPGLSVAVVRRGKVVKFKTYGLEDVEHQVPVSRETVYPIASITKIFTSTAILKLAEEGRLRLDAPIGEILPDLPETWRPVTIRQCLSHTSGLPDSYKIAHGLWQQPENEAALRAIVSRAPFEFLTGSQCAYNQTGFQLLAQIVEKRSGAPFQEFLQERLLKPAGISRVRFTEYASPSGNTFFTPVVPHLAPSYIREGDTLRHAAFYHPVWDRGTSSLQLTLDDLIHWDQALDRSLILKRSSLEQAWKPAALNNGTPAKLFWASYGLGWQVGDHHGHRYVGHLGGNSVWYGRFPDDGLCVIVLTNLEGSNPADLALSVADLYLQDRK